MTGKIRGLRSRDESRVAAWIAPHPVPDGEWLRIEGAIGRALTDLERDHISQIVAHYRWMKSIPPIPAQDVRNTLRRIETSEDDEEVLRLFEQCDVSSRAYLIEALYCDIDFEPQPAWSIDGSAEFWRVNRPAHPIPLVCERADLYRIAASVALRNVLKRSNHGGRPVKGYQKLFAERCQELWGRLTPVKLTISDKDGGASRYAQFAAVMQELIGDHVGASRREKISAAAKKGTGKVKCED